MRITPKCISIVYVETYCSSYEVIWAESHLFAIVFQVCEGIYATGYRIGRVCSIKLLSGIDLVKGQDLREKECHTS